MLQNLIVSVQLLLQKLSKKPYGSDSLRLVLCSLSPRKQCKIGRTILPSLRRITRPAPHTHWPNQSILAGLANIRIMCMGAYKVKVFFCLVIYLAIGNSCIFEDNPISDDYQKKIDAMENSLLLDYKVDMPRIIPVETEDQKCKNLLTLFLSKIKLEKIPRGSILNKTIKALEYEIHFVETCFFKIPSSCPNKRVNISTFLQNIKESLSYLKLNIESNFSHCLHVKCGTDEQVSTMKSTVATKRPNHGQQAPSVDVLSEEHTTPTLNFNGSSSDPIFDTANQSLRQHYIVWAFIAIIVCILSLMGIICCIRRQRGIHQDDSLAP